MASAVREVQAFAVVGVIAIGLPVVRGGLIRQDRFRPVVDKTCPDLVVARLQRVRPIVLYVLQYGNRQSVLAGVDEDASLVRLRRPLTRSSLRATPRRRGQ